MKRIVIWGTGGLAKSVFLLSRHNDDFPLVAFAASREYCDSDNFLGLPLIPDDELEKNYPPQDFEMLVCIGFKEMNELRARVYERLQARGYSFCNFIHPTAIINESVKLGVGNIILEGVIIGTNCKIGNSNVIMGGCLLSHDLTMEDYCHLSLGIAFGGFVTVKKYCYIGLNATIFPYVTLAEKTLVGASTVIAKDTRAYEVYESARSILLEKRSTDVY